MVNGVDGVRRGGVTSLIAGFQFRVVGFWNNASACLTVLALKTNRPMVVVSDEEIYSAYIYRI